MSEALIIAIIGQIATISIVIIQQICTTKNFKKQTQLDLRKNYYNEKVVAYKKLLAILSAKSIEKSLGKDNPVHDIFFKEVLIYASDAVVDKYFEFEDEYNSLVSSKDNISMQTFRKKLKNLGFIAGQIHSIIRDEINEF